MLSYEMKQSFSNTVWLMQPKLQDEARALYTENAELFWLTWKWETAKTSTQAGAGLAGHRDFSAWVLLRLSVCTGPTFQMSLLSLATRDPHTPHSLQVPRPPGTPVLFAHLALPVL